MDIKTSTRPRPESWFHDFSSLTKDWCNGPLVHLLCPLHVPRTSANLVMQCHMLHSNGKTKSGHGKHQNLLRHVGIITSACLDGMPHKFKAATCTLYTPYSLPTDSDQPGSCTETRVRIFPYAAPFLTSAFCAPGVKVSNNFRQPWKHSSSNTSLESDVSMQSLDSLVPQNSYMLDGEHYEWLFNNKNMWQHVQ